jgi:hypothetical protein
VRERASERVRAREQERASERASKRERESCIGGVPLEARGVSNKTITNQPKKGGAAVGERSGL